MKTVVVTGAAGLVGQNLIPRLKARGWRIVGVDKHPTNTARLRELHPDIEVISADLSQPGAWSDAFAGVDAVVLNQAQIGGLEREPFVANNVTATEHILAAMAKHDVPYFVHISSSVVNSRAQDLYVETKTAQEKLVDACEVPHVVLRPTLMFGWFDRKHLGWLRRFMDRSPVFPIPGSGLYLRQPLYAGDFCDIIVACIERRPTGQTYNISGQEQIAYIDLIRAVKEACGARAAIVRIPYSLFWILLYVYGLFDRDPPFTTRQLEALVTPDVFEVIDWPGIFGVKATPLKAALSATFRHPDYAQIVLEF